MTITKHTLEPGNVKLFPKIGDEATIHYAAKLVSDDETFEDSSPLFQLMTKDLTGEKEFRFRIGDGHAIPGLDEAVATMSLGERALFHITPPSAVDGETGAQNFVEEGSVDNGGAVIPPLKAHIAYEVTLIDIDEPLDPAPDYSADLAPRA